jgi:succinate dehydrogenase flavin-adding protein (antitoxin of CptAB toxin-antitoxin module)
VAAAQWHDDAEFRGKVLRELEKCGSPLAKNYACLKDALQIPHDGIQRYVLQVLTDLKEKARDAMVAVVAGMKHTEPEIRRQAFDILKSLKPPARAKAFQVLLNPTSDADEQASLVVFKTLLGESSALTSDEINALAECLRETKRRTTMRCFAVENLGEGADVVQAVPALVAVLRQTGDVKLLMLVLKKLESIGDHRKEVGTALRKVATTAGQEEVRRRALEVLEHLDPSSFSAAQLVQRWTEENSDRVKQTLDKMLYSRIARLMPGQMKQLLPILRRKESEIVLIGLQVVQERKEDAADVAAEVVDLLKREDPSVRKAALNALEAIGPAAETSLPRLTQQMLEYWPRETDTGVKQTLGNLLLSRLSLLERKQMTQLRPFLSHRDAEVVVLGLKAVQAHKKEAADLVEDVAGLLKHDSPKVRTAALNALQTLGSTVNRSLPRLTAQLLDSWTGEKKNPTVREALKALLLARLAVLKRAQMEELKPLLGHKDPEIVLVALKVVQEHKEEAEDIANEVAKRLDNDSAKVRVAAVASLKALGSATAKALPNLSRLLLDHWTTEKEADVKEVLHNLLRSRLAQLKREQMKELRPVLRHKNPEMVLMGLKLVQEHKQEAAAVAEDVAGLIEDNSTEVRATALATLKVLGTAADKALPKLFEVLDKTNKYERTSLALTTASLVDTKDATNIDRLVPFLLEGLHPKALEKEGKEDEIDRVLLKIAQPAFVGSLQILNKILEDKSAGRQVNSDYRKTLYGTLARLGPKCKSKDNYDLVHSLWLKEAKLRFNDKLIKAASAAMHAVDPE